MGRKRSELSPEERVRKLYNDEFHRRTRTMIDKAHDFKISFPAAQIHTLIEHLGKYYVYTSFDDSRRPPSVKNIVRTTQPPPRRNHLTPPADLSRDAHLWARKSSRPPAAGLSPNTARLFWRGASSRKGRRCLLRTTHLMKVRLVTKAHKRARVFTTACSLRRSPLLLLRFNMTQDRPLLLPWKPLGLAWTGRSVRPQLPRRHTRQPSPWALSPHHRLPRAQAVNMTGAGLCLTLRLTAPVCQRRAPAAVAAVAAFGGDETCCLVEEAVG